MTDELSAQTEVLDICLENDALFVLQRENEELRLQLDLLKAAKRPPRQILRWYGSKARLAQWIISHFPPHFLYVEPFFGSGAVFFSKPPSASEIVNDMSDGVINFFTVLRDQPDALIRAILLTPYALAEYKACFDEPATGNALEDARRFYCRVEMGFNGIDTHNSGFRRERKGASARNVSVCSEFNSIAHLYDAARRLKHAQIDHEDAFSLIERYDSPETLFYIDPPYVYRTRGTERKRYEHEMDDTDQRRLADLLRGLKGMVILSGYPSALYDELYADWRCVTHQTTDVAGGQQTECLWISPKADDALSYGPLFKGLDR